MSWTEERIVDLTRLWEAGHSASEIGESLGVSKNAVIGKAHRLKLSSRPSPIRRTASVKPKRMRPPKPVHHIRPTPVYRAPAMPVGNQRCLWPHGDPGDEDFHFCGAAAVIGKPYCPDHCARAYITRSRPNSVAA